MNESYYILIGCILVGLILLFWEFRGKGRLKAIRIFVTFLLMVSLYFLLSSGNDSLVEQGLLIVTPGASEESEASFLKDHRNWQTLKVNSDQPYAFVSAPEADSVVLIGNGLLAESDIQIVAETSAEYQFSSLPPGATDLRIPGVLQANTDQFGTISFSKEVKKVLFQRQGKLDTLSVLENEKLTLPLFSPVAGRFVYRITMLGDASEEIGRIDLPLLYRESRPLNIALRSNFPLAEINYLKNHLAGAGHSITSSIQLSRNITTWDFINTVQDKRNVLSRLDEFDILFITGSGLNTLSTNDSRLLLEAMDSGLGLFVWRDASNNNRNVELSSLSTSNQTAGSWEEKPIQQFGYAFSNQSGVFQKNDIGEPIIVKSDIGSGTRLESVVAQSFPILLRGDSVGYRSYWNEVLSAVQRRTVERFISLPSAWQPAIDFPMIVSFQSERPLAFSIDSIDINLDQDPFQSDIWHARYWPLRDGWHKLIISDSLATDSAFFYVGARGWDRLRANEVQQKNGRFTKNAHSIDPGRMSVPRTLWIVLCCCCFVYLWAEPRFL